MTGRPNDARAREPHSPSEAPTLERAPASLASAPTLPHGQGVTLRSKPTPSLWQGVQSQPAAVDPVPVPMAGDRYERRRVLGQGGMGEVVLSHDAWLGREVAMKRMREVGAGSDGRARFLHEARVQGQLEHPAVVPVYDLALGEAREPYFTMKRVQGLTLREILDRKREGDAAAEAAFGRRRLLASMQQVALALAYAHARGVVHRDLKPENIMLGEFGEVYVLDWGIAKAGAGEAPTGASVPPPSGAIATEVGALVGTPGYMSPEQARGEAHAVTSRSDVYALGAILFEVLTLEPLHRGRTVPELVVSALSTDGVRPSERAPAAEVPPELDDLCARATALEPEERPASMRELADALERYLDGERDLERRRELAGAHLERAQEALSGALRGGEDAERQRALGLRELGRALALDPSQRAVALLSQVVLDAPDELPAEAEAELKKVELADRARAARRAVLVYAIWIVVLAVTGVMGIRSWEVALTVDAVVLVTIGYTWWMARTGNTGPRYMRAAIVLNFLVAMAFSTATGPLFLVPQLALLVAAALLVSLRANRLTRSYITAMAMLTILLPLGLEWAGLVPRSFLVEDGVIKILPRLSEFSAGWTELLVVSSSLGMLLANTLMVGRASDALVASERRNLAQAYRLRQLLPAEAGATGVGTGAP